MMNTDTLKARLDFSFSTLARISHLLSDYLIADITPASRYEDCKLSFDLKATRILHPNLPVTATIAVRLRLCDATDYSAKYPNQITLRSYAAGRRCELDKNLDGVQANILAYGYLKNGRIYDVSIWDMSEVLKRIHKNPALLRHQYMNKDGTGFCALKESDFKGCVIVRKLSEVKEG